MWCASAVAPDCSTCHQKTHEAVAVRGARCVEQKAQSQGTASDSYAHQSDPSSTAAAYAAREMMLPSILLHLY